MLHAQNAGASQVVMIHTTNNRDSVQLSMTGHDAAASQITIPCYTVRQGIGAKIGLMLPSMVGITLLASDESSRSEIQNRVTMSNPTVPLPPLAVAKADVPNTNDAADKTVEIVDIGWRLAPNPTTEELTIHYSFSEKTATSLAIFNETGQLVTNYELTPAQSGQLVVNVEAWRTGTYQVRMRHGRTKDGKRFLVIH